jgi:outer membrane autotransporter protein
MHRKLKKRLRQRRLAAIISLTLALAAPAAPAWADIGAQSFNDGASHTISDNINTGTATGLSIANLNTSALMNNLTITVSGAGRSGASSTTRGSITLTNVTVSAADGYGVVATNFGTLRMTGGSVATNGSGNFGAGASLSGQLHLTGVNVSTNGTQAYGAYAFANGQLFLTDVAVNTASGVGAYGVYAENNGAITMTGGSITTVGAASHGAAVQTIGTVNLTNVAINASGAGSYALCVIDGGTITASVNGQNISGDISGGGGLIAVLNGGTVNLKASGYSRLYGLTAMTGTGTINLTLNGTSSWTNPGLSSNLTNLTLGGGSVVFTAPTDIADPLAYKTLMIYGNLAGSGAFYLNSNLAASDAAGNNLADAITITPAATASGSHHLYVRNWGGTPVNLYQTVRLTNLIGVSTATFGGGSDVGAYRYGVTTGSALSAAYAWNGNAWDYYLYNTFGPSTPARAALSTHADSLVVWYGEMNEIKKRLGELRMGRQSSDDFWVRAYSDRFDVKPSGTSAYSQLMRGLEIGKDNPQAFAGGKKYTGFVAGSGKGDNTFTSGGSGATRSTYLGTYASWLNDDGTFFDLIGKYNWFRHSFDTPLLGGGADSGTYRNQGLGLSAELGKRFSRPDGTFVEPAVELSGLWAGKASYATANGLAVEVPATRSLQLRLGSTVGRKWQGKDGASREIYGKAAWVNEFAGSSTVSVDSVGFENSLKGHQWVAGLGFVEDTGDGQIYIDAEKSWGNTTSKKWGVNAGYRWKF